MHVPSAVCKQLYRLHPWLRFAWKGAEGEGLNCGDFAVIQLYHISNAGTIDDPNTFYSHWEDNWGPIFNRNGGTNLDYDPMFRRPIYVALLGSFDISKEEVFSGAVIPILRDWLWSARDGSVAKHRAGMGRDMVRNIQDLGGEITDKLWSLASNSGESGPTATWEESREALRQAEIKKEIREQALLHYYDVPGM